MTRTDAFPRLPRPLAKTVGLWAVLAALAGFVVFAALREAGKTTAPAMAPSHADDGLQRRTALSPADERFAQDLSSIHAAVRSAALRMTFAGLSYKMGDSDRASIASKVTPLSDVFREAASALGSLETPASMQQTSRRYAHGLQLYLDASREMVKVAQDGDDAHLLDAQKLSEQASGILLEVGDQLWPGEIKPN